MSAETKRMDALRAARGLPPQTRENLMDRTRAAVCYANTRDDEGVKLAAFMALFHPEVSEEKTRGLVSDVRAEQRRYR